MNVLFMTQSSTLSVFYDLMRAMRDAASLERIGFYAADSRYFRSFKEKAPDIDSGAYSILKEWDIVRESRAVTADVEALTGYERTLGRPLLWNALVADRRIYFGRKYAYAQDYKPRFDHARMLALLQVALRRLEKLFDEVCPDLVISFQCMTIGDYLSYLFSRARGAVFLNLRPTRIRNYFYAGESILEPSEHLQAVYERMMKGDADPALLDEAGRYLDEVRGAHAMYEGVVPTSHRPPPKGSAGRKLTRLMSLRGLIRLLSDEWRFRLGEDRFDNHLSGSFGPLLSEKVVRPWRAHRLERRLGPGYVRAEDLTRLDYAFFPLHTEPEITLSVYSKPYLNQIEAVRLISHNLPVGMTLVVKEHPWSIGKRTAGYYRKLLEIPNVRLAHPGMSSRELVSRAKLVTVIAGSIAFEGLILGKPVVVLSRAPFNFLPASVIRAVGNPGDLGADVRDLLEHFKPDDSALRSYVAAIMKESVPVDFYSRLLGRRGVYTPSASGREALPAADAEERDRQVRSLSGYLLRRYEGMRIHERVS